MLIMKATLNVKVNHSFLAVDVMLICFTLLC